MDERRHVINAFAAFNKQILASSLLILFTLSLAEMIPGTFTLNGGNLSNVNTNKPRSERPLEVGLQLLSVHFSREMVAPRVVCKYENKLQRMTSLLPAE